METLKRWAQIACARDGERRKMSRGEPNPVNGHDNSISSNCARGDARIRRPLLARDENTSRAEFAGLCAE